MRQLKILTITIVFLTLTLAPLGKVNANLPSLSGSICNQIGGYWSTYMPICTISGFANAVSFVIPVGVSLVITKTGNLNNTANTLVNYGSIINEGAFTDYSGGSVSNWGTFLNTGTVTSYSGGTINNSGLFLNFLTGTVKNAGIINNYSGCWLENPQGVLTANSCKVNDVNGATSFSGIINNYGVVTNKGTITNFPGSTITNAPDGIFKQCGILKQYGSLNNAGIYRVSC